MRKFLSVILISIILFQGALLCSCSPKAIFTKYSFDYFDTAISVQGYESSKSDFQKQTDRIFDMYDEYHKLFTIYDSYEGINNLHTVNSLTNGAHTTVEVDRKIIDLLLFSKEMYEKTDGAVNIAMGSVLSIWHDYRENGISDPLNAKLPPASLLSEAGLHSDINNIIIDEESCTVLLSDPQMTLDVGAIAKGYATEMIAQTLEAQGISGYVLNAGGNVRTIGAQANGKSWQVGVENPYGSEDSPYFVITELAGMSLVTSGSYQRYYIVDGKKYNHIINPDTLMSSDIYLSVSVIAKSSALADALSTALFSMPYEEGSAFVESLDGVEVMWVFDENNIKYSSGFSEYVQK